MGEPGGSLVERVGGLLTFAHSVVAGTDLDGDVTAIEERIREPLRVAIAGKVKAGKSTLLNALIGEHLAPTDAGECTRVVTWFQDGLTYRVTIEPRDGPPRPGRFNRLGGALEMSLDGLEPDAVKRIVVEWPTAALREVTLIDTPGTGSASTAEDVAAAFLAPAGEADRPADAVVYLMRHLHPTDTRFLEAFSTSGDFAAPTPGEHRRRPVEGRRDGGRPHRRPRGRPPDRRALPAGQVVAAPLPDGGARGRPPR